MTTSQLIGWSCCLTSSDMRSPLEKAGELGRRSPSGDVSSPCIANRYPQSSPIGFAGAIITIGRLGVCNTCVRVEKETRTAALRTGIGKARRLGRLLNEWRNRLRQVRRQSANEA